MKKSGLLFAKIALPVLMASLALACGSVANSAPPITEVQAAYAAMGSIVTATQTSTQSSFDFSGSAPYAYSTSMSDAKGGSLFVTATTTADPSASPFTARISIILTNWHDATTGCILNGNISFSLASTVSSTDMTTFPRSYTSSTSCNISLLGGDVATLSGTVTANGYSYDVTTL